MTSTAMLTDQYELTMLSAALRNGVAHQKAVFELFARKLPAGRRYGIVAGTGRAIEAVRNFRFTEEDLDWIEQNNIVNQETLDYLADYKFSGTISGYHEGDLYFPNSPVLTVEATFGEAVLLETVLLSIMNYDSAVASAAARMVQAAEGIPLAELGARRMNEQAAVAASRASYITGFKATSNLQAGKCYGIPTMGTSAHAFTLAHDTEVEAFQAQVDALGTDTTLLVDTYDIAQGIRNAVAVAGPELGAIRIDSGDLHEETLNARALLDSLGAVNTKIVLSSDIDEYTISELVERKIPVDSIGAGTRVVTGSGHVTASMVYKLVSIEGSDGQMRPVEKKASGKKSVGGRKWAYRTLDNQGHVQRERIVVNDSSCYREGYRSSLGVRALQKFFIENGEVVFDPTLEEIRTFHRFAMAELRPLDRNILSGSPSVEALV